MLLKSLFLFFTIVAMLLPCQSISASLPESWKTVVDKDQRFQISVPSNWTVNEYRSDFSACEDNDLCLHIQQVENPESLSSHDFFRKMEEKENSAEVSGLIYEEMVQGKIGGLEAVTLRDVFTYDSGAEETIIAYSDKAFILSFTSDFAEEAEYPEKLKKREKLNEVVRTVVQTFKVLER
jgi:predicted Zn-dependent protease